MKVRKALESDNAKIQKIADSLRINIKNPEKRGFLVNVLSSEEYKSRLNENFYVAEENNEIIGFLMSYSDKIIEKFLAEGKLKKGGVADFLLNRKRPFIWGDQIGVVISKKGIGKALINELFKSEIKNFYVDILHEPVKNSASIAFCSTLGFKLVSEVKEGAFLWGIYKLER